MRVALYARFSTDLQSAASIEDQLRICRAHCKREQWTATAEYSDAAISGGSLINRPGIRALLADAATGKFDIVVAEALDRLSRDLEDIAGLHKRLKFAGVRIVTLSEGEIGDLHIGLKGTMSQLFLTDLAAKTRRGMRGRIEQGAAAGGISFGYKAVRKLDAKGNPIKGERVIDKAQAKVIVRIYTEYANGQSPREIAARLNDAGIKPPRGETWSPSAIHGDAKRQVGILANPIYRGQMIWNRCRFVKSPDSGKRLARQNPPSEWIVKDAPHLRIVPQPLWDAVQKRLNATHTKSARIREALRISKSSTGRGPRYLLSSLLTCAVCDGPYSIVNSGDYGCSNHFNRGDAACRNATRVRRDLVEAKVLEAVKRDLFTPACLDAFKRKVRELMAKRSRNRGADTDAARQELGKVETEIANILTAIRAGILSPTVKADLERAEAEKARIERSLRVTADPIDNLETILPRTIDRYRDLVSNLENVVSRDTSRARNLIRELVGGSITLKPVKGGGLNAELAGHYAGLIALAKENPAGKGGAFIGIYGCGDRI